MSKWLWEEEMPNSLNFHREDTICVKFSDVWNYSCIGGRKCIRGWKVAQRPRKHMQWHISHYLDSSCYINFSLISYIILSTCLLHEFAISKQTHLLLQFQLLPLCRWSPVHYLWKWPPKWQTFLSNFQFGSSTWKIQTPHLHHPTTNIYTRSYSISLQCSSLPFIAHPWKGF